MLATLLGSKAMSNIVIATTMWSRVSEEEGRGRENELKSIFLKDMMADGCKTKRFEKTSESAWDIVRMNPSASAHLQEGLDNIGKSIAAARAYGPRKDGFSGWLIVFREAVLKVLLR